jgi:hypothetical protein
MKAHIILRTILLILGSLLAPCVPAFAQDSVDKKPVVRFTVWGNWSDKVLHIKHPDPSRKPEEEYVKIDLLDLGYSAEIPFLRGKPIDLCTPVEKDGKTVWETLITVNIPAGIREPLVLIFPKGDGEESARYRVFELHPSVFPFGDYQLVNLSTVPLYAKLDETVLNLPAGESGHFKGSGQKQLNVWLRVAAEDLEKNTHIVFSSMMRNRIDKRMFMFFYPPDENSDTPTDAKIAVRTLVDFAPQEAE